MGAVQAGGPRKEEPTAGHYVFSGQRVRSRPREVTRGPGVISSQLSENASSTTEGHGPLLDQQTPKGGLRAPQVKGSLGGSCRAWTPAQKRGPFAVGMCSSAKTPFQHR